MSRLILFHTKKCPPFAKFENYKVAEKLQSNSITNYEHYIKVCNIYGAIPYPEEVFNNHLLQN